MRPVSLPPGLEDDNLEIYIHKGDLRVIYQGKAIALNELPSNILDFLEQHIMANKTAIKSLMADFHLTDPNEMLQQYIKCNFGNFDGEPDIDREHGIMLTECWDCGKRGVCPGEGKVCSRLKGKEGMLTRRETEIFFLVIDGKQDKEIADHFNVTISTVMTQLKRIRHKLGVNNRVEIMGYALKRKLIII